jgi:hypothetical protein
MFWPEMTYRMLPPTTIGGVPLPPHITSAYGVRRDKGTSPHRDIDLNYDGLGQSGLNLLHPAIHPPVDDWLARLFKLVR